MMMMATTRRRRSSSSGGCSKTQSTAGVAKLLSANMAAQDELSKFLSALLPINISLYVEFVVM